MHTPTPLTTQLQFEYLTHQDKLAVYKTEFRRLSNQLKQQLQQIRLAQTAILSYTNTKRSRQNFSLRSQELSQTFLRFTTAKSKCRDLLLNMDRILKDPNGEHTTHRILTEFLTRHPQEIKAWFPFGMWNNNQNHKNTEKHRRIIPRSAEAKQELTTYNIEDEQNMLVATAISLIQQRERERERENHHKEDHHDNSNNIKTTSSSSKIKEGNSVPTRVIITTNEPMTISEPEQNGENANSSANNDNDNDADSNNDTTKQTPAKNQNPASDTGDDHSGVSLDDLKCCICFRGEATDENDLVMCDGLGCFRSHHMQCLNPPVTASDIDQQEHWFCPLCQALAKLLVQVQSEYTGEDEWGEENGNSIKSWEAARDVFPEVLVEHQYALQWKSGKIDQDCKEFLIQMFGDCKHSATHQESDDEMLQGGSGGEDNDDEEDDDFDLQDFQKERTKDYGDDDSDHSSQATLQDMSSVEIKIKKSELAALSSGGESEDSSDEEEGGKDDDDDKKKDSLNEQRSRRKSRRLRGAAALSSRNTTDTEGGSTDGGVSSDPGKLDESNILKHKRRRRKVDYQRLNDSLFGTIIDPDKLDDQDEFQFKYVRRNSNSSSSSQEEDDEDQSDDDDDNNGNDNDDKSGNKKVEKDEDKEGSTSGEQSESESEKPKATSAVSSPTKNKRSARTTGATTPKKKPKQEAKKATPKKGKGGTTTKAKAKAKAKAKTPPAKKSNSKKQQQQQPASKKKARTTASKKPATVSKTAAKSKNNKKKEEQEIDGKTKKRKRVVSKKMKGDDDDDAPLVPKPRKRSATRAKKAKTEEDA